MRRIVCLMIWLLIGNEAGLAQAPPSGPDQGFLHALLERHRPEETAFEFAAIGDQQYGEEGEAKWPALQASINNSDVAFTLHIGDFKSGSTMCSNELFEDRLRAFNSFDAPMIYTPGDNEWPDCHRESNGSFDPLARLGLIRRIFFPSNDSLGTQRMVLSRQSEDARYPKYAENMIWSRGNVSFVTLHVVGSNNNLGRDPEE